MKSLLFVGIMAGVLVWQAATSANAGQRLYLVNGTEKEVRVTYEATHQGNIWISVHLVPPNASQSYDDGGTLIRRLRVEVPYIEPDLWKRATENNNWRTICDYADKGVSSSPRSLQVTIRSNESCSYTIGL